MLWKGSKFHCSSIWMGKTEQEIKECCSFEKFLVSLPAFSARGHSAVKSWWCCISNILSKNTVKLLVRGERIASPTLTHLCEVIIVMRQYSQLFSCSSSAPMLPNPPKQLFLFCYGHVCVANKSRNQFYESWKKSLKIAENVNDLAPTKILIKNWCL